jgi:4-amino-4-deoxy-L-arabinose transferase-like glycosyltransferase
MSTSETAPASAETPAPNVARRPRSLALAALLFAAHLLLCAYGRTVSFGVPLGLALILGCVGALLDGLGSFEVALGAERGEVTGSAALGAIAASLFAFGAFAAAVAGASHLPGPAAVWGLVVTVSFTVFAASLVRVGQLFGAYDERPLWQREGFWVVVASSWIVLPALGSFSLWDPWETHYGEVAREILARSDWISLWWAQDGWFWSKPILNFWIQALAMAALGVGYRSDAFLSPSGAPHLAHPEWAVRTPNALMTILAVYVLYKGFAKAVGRRPAMLGAMVLSTVPDWYFLAHQTMTDMPFVASLTAAMGLLVYGLAVEDDVVAPFTVVRFGERRLRVSAWHLLFGVVLLLALPQIAYLFSRNVELVWTAELKGFRAHFDEFTSGSAGNCGLPGNEACNPQVPAAVPRALVNAEGAGVALRRIFVGWEPIVQGALWSALLAVLVVPALREQRVRRLAVIGAWVAMALATMGKGPAGIVLPAGVVFVYLASTRRWRDLASSEIVSGLVALLVVALPWYVAMFVRHGPPFTDRLIFHDMFNRAFSHVHDTNEGDDTSFRFYVWQLGYALFPWTALAPLALARTVSSGFATAKREAATFCVAWSVLGFALFTMMGTKFHHYAFPIVPPLAMIIGLLLDDLLEEAPSAAPRVRDAAAACAAVFAALAGVQAFFVPASAGAASAPGGAGVAFSGVGAVLVLLAVVLAALALRGVASGQGGAGAGAGLAAGALLLLAVGRDLADRSTDAPGAIRLLQLFTYNYKRPWPAELDFAGPLAAFAVVGAALALLLARPASRRLALVAWLSLASASAVWGLDRYFVATAPHWGQRELFEAYYRARGSEAEPVVAYQMNWKGENIYTGNNVPAFVSSGAPFTAWLKKKQDQGVRRFFFVTEHSRVSGLRSEVQSKTFQELTTKALNNKFVLVEATF